MCAWVREKESVHASLQVLVFVNYTWVNVEWVDILPLNVLNMTVCTENCNNLVIIIIIIIYSSRLQCNQCPECEFHQQNTEKPSSRTSCCGIHKNSFPIATSHVSAILDRSDVTCRGMRSTRRRFFRYWWRTKRRKSTFVLWWGQSAS